MTNTERMRAFFKRTDLNIQHTVEKEPDAKLHVKLSGLLNDVSSFLLSLNISNILIAQHYYCFIK